MAKSPPNFVRKGSPSDDQVGAHGGGLVDQGRADVARLEERGLERQPVLSAIVSARSRTAAAPR